MAEQVEETEEEEQEREQAKADAVQDEDLYAVVAKKPGSGQVKGIQTLAEANEDSPFHKIEFIQDVPLRLSAEIGQTVLSVREILGLNVGSVVEFTKVVGEPMDITVSGRLMARGEIVVVNERYGVRISEVTRPDETGPTQVN
jgi:flagellar motor switch protein FliN/FliY